MRELFPMVLVGMLAIEGLLYFVYPSLLAWVAFIPLKLSRIVEIPPELMGEMPDDDSAGYRQAAKSTVDPAGCAEASVSEHSRGRIRGRTVRWRGPDRGQRTGCA